MIAEFFSSELDDVRDWSLRQLFERFVLEHPAVWQKWRDAAYERPNLDLNFEEVSAVLPGAVWPMRVNAKKLAQEVCERRDAAGSSKAEIAVEEIFVRYNGMIDLLRGGFLVATAKGRVSGKTKPIASNQWWRANQAVNLALNAVVDVDDLQETPDVSTLSINRRTVDLSEYEGRQLDFAFQLTVLKDPTLSFPISAAGTQVSNVIEYAKMGVYWQPGEDSPFWWPLDFAGRDGLLPDGSGNREGLWACMLSDRMRQFLKPLRNGEVEAVGLNAGDQYITIPKTVWAAYEAHINSLRPSLGWLEEASPETPNPRMRTRFTDIEFRVAKKPELTCPTPDTEADVSESVVPLARASDARVIQLLKEEFSGSWRPKGEAVSGIVEQTGASKRRVLHLWDSVVVDYPERRKAGRRKKT